MTTDSNWVPDLEYANFLVNLLSAVGEDSTVPELVALSNRAHIPLEVLLAPLVTRVVADRWRALDEFVDSIHGSTSTVPIVGFEVPDLDVLYLQIGNRYFRVSGASRLEQVGGITT